MPRRDLRPECRQLDGLRQDLARLVEPSAWNIMAERPRRLADGLGNQVRVDQVLQLGMLLQGPGNPSVNNELPGYPPRTARSSLVKPLSAMISR